ncbi:ABC transporter permease [Bacteroidota bacterium]
MLRNYFKTAYRILVRNKVFSLINIFGLSVGLTSIIVIFLFIINELNFDKHHSNFDRIYKVVNKQMENNRENFDEAVPVPLSGVLKEELTGHDHVTQIYFSHDDLLRIEKEKYMEEGLLYVDTNFTKVFDVEFIEGNPQDFRDPFIIFLTEDIANKYFGSVSNAINKEIIIMDSISLNVRGVVKNPPKQTHIPYKYLISLNSLSTEIFKFDYNSWGTRMSGFGTYLTIKEGVSENKITDQISKIVINNVPEDQKNDNTVYFLLPLKEIHFDDRFGSYSGAYIISKKLIWIFSSVGLFILMIAFVNFTNLSIVQTIKRAKEVGIRKVVGADRIKLIKQFLGETFLLIFIAEVISLILTEVVLDKINAASENIIKLKLYGDNITILFLIVLLILLTFLSGIYPALVLSRYNPIRALRYNMKLGKRKSLSLYSLLVIFQFFISQILIVSAIVIVLQMNFIKNKDLGFTKENVILVNLPQNQSEKARVLVDMLQQSPDIKKVSLGIGAPMASSNITSSFQMLGDEETDYMANVKTVNASYFDLYNIKLIAGEWYKEANPKDTIFNVVVNKSLLKEVNIEKPLDAIDKYIYVFGSNMARIVGVIEDFHAFSLHGKIPPVIFVPIKDFYIQLHIKTNGKSYLELSSFIEQCWEDVFPEYIYDYDFLEETIEQRYSTDQRFSNIIKIFTIVAIIIACLGLYGLVSFMLVQRTKEIGVRKALGSSVSSILILVSKQYLNLILISCIIAWPVAYYLMKNWLKNYAYKIDINIWIFVLSGIILLLITFLTIFYQALKVAKTNPVNVLRYE